jgi:hypothetical protein
VEVLELLDRLQRRYDAGFGDCTAVITETDVDADGTLDETGGDLTIYARKGPAYLQARYPVGVRMDEQGKVRSRHAARPAGWPTPALDATLAAVEGRLPSFYMMSDGKQASVLGRKVEPGHERSAAARMTLPGNLWPTRVTIGLYGSESKAELLRDDKHPGLVGLRVEQMIVMGGQGENDRQKTISVRWLDPKRDDLPVESWWQTFKRDGETIETESHTTYTAFAQTPDGRWYPSAWKSVVTTTRRAMTGSSSVHHMQVWPGRTLEAKWFRDPMIRPR